MPGPFEASLRAFAQRAGANADLAVRKIVLDMGARLVARSPVDTGRFRSNWRYGLGEIDGATSDRSDVHIVNGIGNLPVKAGGKVHYITNNLPYAWSLERGHSKQAPQGMVALTVLEFSSIVDTLPAEILKGAASAYQTGAV